MSYNASVKYTYNNHPSVTLKNIENPRFCPRCHHAIDPTLIAVSIESIDSGSMMFFCRSCYKSFIAMFEHHGYHNSNTPEFLKFTDLAPLFFKGFEFPKIINELSQRFVAIYNQALNAESLGLNEICGMGYRKSLEVLIKDYVIRKKPEIKEEVNDSKYWLNQCINDHIEEPRIKNPSKAAYWLGNDETHYSRRHDFKDVSDLKDYIMTVVYFIQYDLAADESAEFVGN